MPIPLPSFQCAAYRRQAPLWSYLDDVYTGSEAWLHRLPDGTVKPNVKTNNYLSRKTREREENYVARLVMTPFEDRFAQAIRDFVGMVTISGTKFQDVPDAIALHWQNLSGSGQPGDGLIAEMGKTAMRRGHTFALVDVPRYEGGQSLADAAIARPYWVHVHAHDVLNWRVETANGKQRLIQATIRQSYLVPDGAFGETEEVSYLVLSPGRFDTFVIKLDAEQKPYPERVAQRSGVHGVVRSGRVVPFTEIPLVCLYGGDRVGFFESRPPLKALADLNVTHYQIHSDHLRKIDLCCFPVAVRFGVLGDQDELVLGPDTVIDAPPGGGFSWQEPNAGSIDKSRQELRDIETAMDFLGAQYLIKPSDRQAAAVSFVQAAKVESSLHLFTESFIEGVNQALRFHAMYLGLSDAGVIELDTRFFRDRATDSQMLMAYSNLATRDLIDKRGFLALAKLAGFFPDEFDVEAMIKRTGETIALVPIGAVNTAPANEAALPSISPQQLITTYLELVKSDKLDSDKLLTLLDKFGLPAGARSANTTPTIEGANNV